MNRKLRDTIGYSAGMENGLKEKSVTLGFDFIDGQFNEQTSAKAAKTRRCFIELYPKEGSRQEIRAAADDLAASAVVTAAAAYIPTPGDEFCFGKYFLECREISGVVAVVRIHGYKRVVVAFKGELHG